MTWTYNNDPSASDTAAVRFEVQDIDPDAPLLADEEVNWAVLRESGQAANGSSVTLTEAGLFGAAARCCEALVRRFAAQADTSVGSLKVTYTKQAAQYAERATELRAKASGMASPYAGGQSISEKQAAAQDLDRVQPAFSRGQWDTPWAGVNDGAGLGFPLDPLFEE
jgi:hypothetical protein